MTKLMELPKISPHFQQPPRLHSNYRPIWTPLDHKISEKLSTIRKGEGHHSAFEKKSQLKLSLWKLLLYSCQREVN